MNTAIFKRLKEEYNSKTDHNQANYSWSKDTRPRSYLFATLQKIYIW